MCPTELPVKSHSLHSPSVFIEPQAHYTALRQQVKSEVHHDHSLLRPLSMNFDFYLVILTFYLVILTFCLTISTFLSFQFTMFLMFSFHLLFCFVLLPECASIPITSQVLSEKKKEPRTHRCAYTCGAVIATQFCHIT